MSARPTLLLISQVYPPDPTSVGQHMHDAFPIDAQILSNNLNLARKLHRQTHELLGRTYVKAQRVLVADYDDALCRWR